MILRYLVALPCYNNSETVEQVILDTLAETIFPLLLIDDGSDIPVRETLSNPQVLEAIESGRLSFFRHQENNGKGAALQTAFKWALKNNFTHVITVDTDGQHLAKEIPKVLAKSRECPWSLVIGSRKWQGAVPGSSKFGRKFSNFWVKFETGYKALDSQSGFRIYPLFHIQNFSFYTTKYDFEIEVLIRLLWTKVDVQEVDIVVHYAAPGVRVTHFNKFWDNVRISLLNCVLVTVSLLRGHMEPARSGVAIGAGVMVGVSPFFGIHTFMAAAVALLFRLNFLLVFIGTQIGLPFFAPFIAIASIRIGRRILARHGGPGSHLQMPHNLNQALHMSGRFFTEWLVGSIVLGLVLGLVLGGLYYLFQKAYSSEKKAGWTGKTRGGVLGNGFLKLMLKNFGLRTGYFFLYFIVPYFYIFAPRARSSLSTYWRGIDPQGSWFDRQRNIIAHFFTFGQVLMDRVYQSYHEKLVFEVSREGPIYIDEVIESARGWVFVGAHVGGWDISSLFFLKKIRAVRAWEWCTIKPKGSPSTKCLSGTAKLLKSTAFKAAPVRALSSR